VPPSVTLSIWANSDNQSTSPMKLIILSMMVIGLLNFPSMTRSGAELPHAHSLFMLAHHHHEHDGEVDLSSPHAAIDTNASRPAAVGPGSRPSLSGSDAEFVGGGPINLALFNLAASNSSFPSSGLARSLTLAPAGRDERPEVPPPRNRFTLSTHPLVVMLGLKSADEIRSRVFSV
jgi:hypothetical protein